MAIMVVLGIWAIMVIVVNLVPMDIVNINELALPLLCNKVFRVERISVRFLAPAKITTLGFRRSTVQSTCNGMFGLAN